jgi:lysophospholipase L1-like esterase
VNAPKHSSPGATPRAVLTGKTAQALAWFLLFCAIGGFKADPRQLLASLRFEPAQGGSWFSNNSSMTERALDVTVEKSSAAAEVRATREQAAAALGVNLQAEDLQGAFRRIEDPTGRAMGSFFEALTRTSRKEPGAITRIMHFGDSLVVVDFLTGQARRRLQERFGDAGHGYMLAGKPWPWYQHWDILYHTSNEWTVDGIMKPKSKGGLYGVAGYAFDGSGPGEFVEYATSPKGEVGRRVSRFEAHYLVRPGGGSFAVSVDGAPYAKVKTAGPAVKSGVYVVKVKDGAHRFRLQCLGDGPVRLFGAVLERDTPGVVYDTLGVNGGRARTLDRIDPNLWAEQLRLRRPDLVVFNFGTNESEDADRPMSVVEADYLGVLRRIRASLPAASCLVVSPADRASRVNGRLTTNPIIPRLIETQRRAALQAGCAFYNTYEAMGGRGSMARWYTSKPAMCAGDMTHPNRRGADFLGDALYRSLVNGLLEFAGGGLHVRTAAAAPSVTAPAAARPLDGALLPDQPDPYPPLLEQPRFVD